MPRKMLSVEVKLNLKQVSCPGVLHITDRNLVFIRIALLGQLEKTKPVFATFPFKFNERLHFKREFTNAKSLDTVTEILEDENVMVELCQYNEGYKDGRILASFTQSTKEFLFPAPTLLSETNPLKELLLTRCCHFLPSKALDPKLTFTTKTTVKEIDGLERLRKIREKPKKNFKQVQEYESPSSGTDEEIIITTSNQDQNKSRKSLINRHCFCECPYRTDTKRLSAGNEDIRSKMSFKPPFKTGKAREDLISKRQFDDDGSPKIGKKVKKKRRHSSVPKFCSACESPHPDCIVCDSFIKVYGKDFARHRFQKPKTKTTPNGFMQENFLEAPVPPRISSTPYHVPLVRARPPTDLSPELIHRPQKPIVIHSAPPKPRHSRPVRRDRSSVTAGNGMHRSKSVDERIRHLLKKNQSALRFDLGSSTSSSEDDDVEDDDEDFMPTQDLRRSLPIDDRSTDEIPNRSVVVPLGDGDYWLSTQGKYSDRSHRQVFNDSLGSIYREMYRTTRDGK